MQQFKIKWSLCPHNQHQRKINIIEAPSARAAGEVLTDHVLRTYQTDWFTTFEVELYLPLPEGSGRVIS